MKIFFAIILFCFVFSADLLSPEVAQLCNDYWDWRMEDMPQFATFVGIHDYDHLLDDMSEDAYYLRLTNSTMFKSRATALLPTLTDDTDIVNINVLQYELDTYIDNYNLKGYYLPINNLEGIQIDMLNQFEWMLKETMEDYNKMIDRLQLMPTQIDQTIELLKKGVENNITYNEYSWDNMYNEVAEYDVDIAEDSPFWTYFTNFTNSNVTEKDDQDDIQARAKGAIDSLVSPAFHDLLVYVAEEYITRENIAVTTMTNGQEFYESLIWYHTSTTLTAQEIQDIGYAEVARITMEMEKIKNERGFSNITVQEYSEYIRNDPSNYYDTSDELINGFDDIADEIEPRLPLVFNENSIPTAELSIVAAPSETGAGAYYLGGSYDGTRPGVFYVNTNDVKSQPKYSMMSLSLHEGNPGHHFQGSFAIESEDYPYFRRVMEDRNYGISPSRFPMYTYFIEGWGLYAESLGYEMNLYNDSLDSYGHYSAEIFRACRLVVDTGMHSLNMTRDEAIEYMVNNTASSLSEIKNEIDRYITWPGQALAYKMGELKFDELRNKTQACLGEYFDLKDFHDVILNSLGPMTIVESQIDNYIIDFWRAPPMKSKSHEFDYEDCPLTNKLNKILK